MKLNNGYLYRKKFIVKTLLIIDFLVSIFSRRKRPFPSLIKKILIIKPDHLGDMLLLTAIFPCIVNRYPEAQIDIVCGSWAKPVLVGNKYINKIYNVDHVMHNRSNGTFFSKFARFSISFFKALKAIRKEKYDICLVMRAYGGNLLTLAKLSGCKFVIGHATGGLGPFCDKVVEWQKGRHEVEHFLEVLAPLGIECQDIQALRSELNYTEEDKKYVNDLLLKNKLEINKFAIIHPGAGQKEKLLAVDLWAALSNKINMPIVICGTEKEKQYFYGIASLCGDNVKLIDLTEQLTISQLAFLFSQARSVFVLDSLAVHLAALSNVEAFTFFCRSSPAATSYVAQWRPLNSNIRVLPSLAATAKFISEYKW